MSESDITQGQLEKVSEMAVEPSWISEIARKLAQVDDEFRNMGPNRRIRVVSRCVQGLKDNSRFEIQRPSYSSFGGQAEASEHTSIAGDGYAPGNEWNRYTLVHNQYTPMASVRPAYRSVINPNVSLPEKLRIASLISEVGNDMAQLSEDILHDQLKGYLDNWVVMNRSSYNDPGVDVYVQDYETVDGIAVDKGTAFEISTRYVNPIGGPYVAAKVNKLMDLEANYGVEVDLVIMAPKFTRGMLNKYAGSRMVHLKELPLNASGNPVIVKDDSTTIARRQNAADKGPDYPLVDSQFSEFITRARGAFREMDEVDETEYRLRINKVIQEVYR